MKIKINQINSIEAKNRYNRKIPQIRRQKQLNYAYDSIVIASDADVDRRFAPGYYILKKAN